MGSSPGILNSETAEEHGSLFNKMKINCLSCTASVQESFRYMRAFFFAQGKKLTAKNEKEASEADLIAAKMQVDATNEAEETKNKLEMEM